MHPAPPVLGQQWFFFEISEKSDKVNKIPAALFVFGSRFHALKNSHETPGSSFKSNRVVLDFFIVGALRSLKLFY